VRHSSASTSPTSIRPIPHPSAAAPAAGGWGIDGSCHVYSVGSSSLAAGGAEEAVAWPESFLWAGFLSSALDAPVELRGGSAAPCASATRQSCGAWFPIAGAREKVDPVVEDLDGAVAVDQAGVVVRGAGWRRSGAEERRLPGRIGAPPSPSVQWRRGGGFRRRGVLCDKDEDGAWKVLVVFFF
jgi:hypothetical protein